ncbi:hypothetical protein DSECCO2_120270 [anaerobic digester metagenome]
MLRQGEVCDSINSILMEDNAELNRQITETENLYTSERDALTFTLTQLNECKNDNADIIDANTKLKDTNKSLGKVLTGSIAGNVILIITIIILL